MGDDMPTTSAETVAINLNLTLADHLKCEIFHSKTYFVINILCYLAFIMVPAIIARILESTVPLAAIFLFSLAIGLLAPIYYLLRVCYLWFRGALPKQMMVTASDSGLVYTIGADYRVTSEWGEVDIYEHGRNFFLWSGKYHLPMPKRCFTPEQLTAFVDALNKNLQAI
jgi:hypothetical protein